jgi:hypothetical protein
LRRSVRLNPGLVHSLAGEQVEIIRARSRRQSRNLREAHRAAEPLQHNHELYNPAPANSNSTQQDLNMSSAHYNHSGASFGGSERSYTLQVAVQPRLARFGAPLYPPLAIRVRITDASTGEEISGEDELHNLFAQATLYGESGNGPPLAPPDLYLLSGRLSMSLDLLNDSYEPDVSTPLSGQQGSYVIFPDLVINRPGRYRLGVSLFKIGDRRRARSASTGPGEVQGGGTSLNEVKSDIIVVGRTPVPIQIGKNIIIIISILLHLADPVKTAARWRGPAIFGAYSKQRCQCAFTALGIALKAPYNCRNAGLWHTF